MKRYVALLLLPFSTTAFAQQVTPPQVSPEQQATEAMLLEQITAHRDWQSRWIAANAANAALTKQLADMKAKVDELTANQKPVAPSAKAP